MLSFTSSLPPERTIIDLLIWFSQRATTSCTMKKPRFPARCQRSRSVPESHGQLETVGAFFNLLTIMNQVSVDARATRKVTKALQLSLARSTTFFTSSDGLGLSMLNKNVARSKPPLRGESGRAT